MSKKKELSDLAKFVIASNKLPKLLELIKIESSEFGSIMATNKELVSGGYADDECEINALLTVLKNLNLIDVSYDISCCGSIVMCRYLELKR